MLVVAGALLACLFVAATIAATAGAYPELPDRVPLHIGPSGYVDQWGPRTSIWVLPAVQMVSLCIMIFAFVAIKLQLPHTHGTIAGLAVFAPFQLAILWRAQLMMIDAARRSSDRVDMHAFWLWFIVLLPCGMAALFLLR